MNSKLITFFPVLLFAAATVGLISYFGNIRPVMWDSRAYLNMAQFGLMGNDHLVAPFAYRFAIPLLMGWLAQFFNTDIALVFKISNFLGCLLFVMLCFWFQKAQGVSNAAAYATTLLVCFFVSHLKLPLFIESGLDIYAYSIFLIAFWLLLNQRFYACLLVSGAGLLVKEFLLIPMAVQVILLWMAGRHASKKPLLLPLIATLLAIMVFLVLPRMLITVVDNVYYISFSKPETLARFLFDPLDGLRNLKILFTYCALWLPVLLLLTRERFLQVKGALYEKRAIYISYMILHFLLVMYGGSNTIIYVGYGFVMPLMVLAVLFSTHSISRYEIAAALIAVFIFNRLWLPIPLPADDMYLYMQAYDGLDKYHFTPRIFARVAELLLFIATMKLVRKIPAPA